MFQANQAHAQITQITGDFPGWITGSDLRSRGLCRYRWWDQIHRAELRKRSFPLWASSTSAQRWLF